MARLRIELLTDDCSHCGREQRVNEVVYDLTNPHDLQSARRIVEAVNLGILQDGSINKPPLWKLPEEKFKRIPASEAII